MLSILRSEASPFLPRNSANLANWISIEERGDPRGKTWNREGHKGPGGFSFPFGASAPRRTQVVGAARRDPIRFTARDAEYAEKSIPVGAKQS